MTPVTMLGLILSIFAGIRNRIVWIASDRAVYKIRRIILRDIHEGKEPDFSLYERLDIRGSTWFKRMCQVQKWRTADFFPWLY